MNDKGFEINVEEVLKMFKELDYKHQIKAYKTALRKSGAIILKQAKKNLKLKLGPGATHVGKYGRMNAGIKNKVYKSGKISKVHIMGDYRLKWFEMGTKVRYKKNSNHSSTGLIRALYFFRTANYARKQEAEDTLIKHLEQSIIKINEKYK